jgi:molybdopterin/thiamine biosynthesis adenylyltransferase
MSKRPQDTSAEEPDGGNPHIRFRGGPRQGDRPGLLNKSRIGVVGAGLMGGEIALVFALAGLGRPPVMWASFAV